MNRKTLLAKISSWNDYTVRMGDEGYFGNSLAQIENAMKLGVTHNLIKVDMGANTEVSHVFVASNKESYGLFLPKNHEYIEVLEE